MVSPPHPPVSSCLSPILGVILSSSIGRCTSGVSHSAPPAGGRPCWSSPLVLSFSPAPLPPHLHLKEKEFSCKRSDFCFKCPQSWSASVDSLSPLGCFIPVVQRKDTLGAPVGPQLGHFSHFVKHVFHFCAAVKKSLLFRGTLFCLTH